MHQRGPAQRREDGSSSRRGGALVTAAVLVAAMAVAGVYLGTRGDAGPAEGDPQAVNPFLGHAGYPQPDSSAALAATRAEAAGHSEDARVFARLAQIPQGIWLTPEEYPPGQVAGFVRQTVEAADATGEVPTFVVYGIPDRDCTGGFSAGGLPPAQYRSWVRQIADAAGSGGRAVAVVEPDALASAVQCDQRAERVRLVRDAVARLREAGVTTYVDGGHSHWVPPGKVAPLLRAVGVESVRGFATDVANFQGDAAENAYATALSRLLGGAHYVIDTGRNGVGSTAQWCNPPGRAFGNLPGLPPESAPANLDAYLWIKPPGESDGTCGGGPPAGTFWPARAMELARDSGW